MESQLVHGDCYEVLPALPKGCVDTIFVDAPYNIGIDYGGGKQDDLLDANEYLGQMEQLVSECIRLLTPAGGIWCLFPERWADHMGVVLSKLLPRRNRIIWRETFGQYRESCFPSGHRHLFWHVMDRRRSTFNTDEIRIPSQRMEAGDKRASGPRVPDDVWSIPRLVGNSHERLGEHPCQLPEALLERVIRCSTNPAGMMLDPMAGSGTTLRVAQRLGRRYFGVEKQANFVALIERRLKQAFQPDLFTG